MLATRRVHVDRGRTTSIPLGEKGGRSSRHGGMMRVEALQREAVLKVEIRSVFCDQRIYVHGDAFYGVQHHAGLVWGPLPSLGQAAEAMDLTILGTTTRIHAPDWSSEDALVHVYVEQRAHDRVLLFNADRWIVPRYHPTYVYPVPASRVVSVVRNVLSRVRAFANAGPMSLARGMAREDERRLTQLLADLDDASEGEVLRALRGVHLAGVTYRERLEVLLAQVEANGLSS